MTMEIESKKLWNWDPDAINIRYGRLWPDMPRWQPRPWRWWRQWVAVVRVGWAGAGLGLGLGWCAVLQWHTRYLPPIQYRLVTLLSLVLVLGRSYQNIIYNYMNISPALQQPAVGTQPATSNHAHPASTIISVCGVSDKSGLGLAEWPLTWDAVSPLHTLY